MTFPTIKHPGFYDRTNQWLVFASDTAGVHYWVGCYETKAQAVEELQAHILDKGEDEVTLGWVVKTPYVVMAE